MDWQNFLKNLFNSEEHFIPENIDLDRNKIDDYREKSVERSLQVNRFGSLEWLYLEDHDRANDKGYEPAVNKINTDLKSVLESEAEESLERSVFYNMGAAIGLHGKESSSHRAGRPNYETICKELFEVAEKSALSGSYGIDVQGAYEEKGEIFKNDLIESAKNVDQIMNELE